MDHQNIDGQLRKDEIQKLKKNLLKKNSTANVQQATNTAPQHCQSQRCGKQNNHKAF